MENNFTNNTNNNNINKFGADENRATAAYAAPQEMQFLSTGAGNIKATYVAQPPVDQKENISSGQLETEVDRQHLRHTAILKINPALKVVETILWIPAAAWTTQPDFINDLSYGVNHDTGSLIAPAIIFLSSVIIIRLILLLIEERSLRVDTLVPVALSPIVFAFLAVLIIWFFVAGFMVLFYLIFNWFPALVVSLITWALISWIFSCFTKKRVVFVN